MAVLLFEQQLSATFQLMMFGRSHGSAAALGLCASATLAMLLCVTESAAVETLLACSCHSSVGITSLVTLLADHLLLISRGDMVMISRGDMVICILHVRVVASC